MNSVINRLPNGNIELTLTLPWADIEKAINEVVDEAVRDAEIKGFRKGHAPRQLVESQLDKNQTLSRALQLLLPKAYQSAINKAGLKPAVYPKIQVQKGKEGEDWKFLAILCEVPKVSLGKITKAKKVEDAVEMLVDKSKVDLADMLVEAESDRRLADLAENLTRLGLTVEKYLTSKKMNIDDLKARLAVEARRDLSREFVLQQVQIDHKLENRQKTLEFLTNIV